jgi:RNA polymerase sigma-70 factor (ECF subfamily)
MTSTSISLLRRLREPQADAAWSRFVDLYAPLIFHWGRRVGLESADAADLVQEVLAVLVVKLPEFEYNPSKRFRGWLRTIALNKACDLRRRADRLSDEDARQFLGRYSVPQEADVLEGREHRELLVRRAFELLRDEFRQSTWQSFWLQMIEGYSAAEVAKKLKISVNAAYVAKCRVLRRLREELDGLID